MRKCKREETNVAPLEFLGHRVSSHTIGSTRTIWVEDTYSVAQSTLKNKSKKNVDRLLLARVDIDGHCFYPRVWESEITDGATFTLFKPIAKSPPRWNSPSAFVVKREIAHDKLLKMATKLDRKGTAAYLPPFRPKWNVLGIPFFLLLGIWHLWRDTAPFALDKLLLSSSGAMAGVLIVVLLLRFILRWRDKKYALLMESVARLSIPFFYYEEYAHVPIDPSLIPIDSVQIGEIAPLQIFIGVIEQVKIQIGRFGVDDGQAYRFEFTLNGIRWKGRNGGVPFLVAGDSLRLIGSLENENEGEIYAYFNVTDGHTLKCVHERDSAFEFPDISSWFVSAGLSFLLIIFFGVMLLFIAAIAGFPLNNAAENKQLLTVIIGFGILFLFGFTVFSSSARFWVNPHIKRRMCRWLGCSSFRDFRQRACRAEYRPYLYRKKGTG